MLPSAGRRTRADVSGDTEVQVAEPPTISNRNTAVSSETDKQEEWNDRLYGATRQMIALANSLDTALPLTYVIVLLTVAKEEGLGPSDYAKKLDISQPQMSRYLIELSVKGRATIRKSGLGVIERREDPKDLRFQRYYLTPRGRAIVREMLINTAPLRERNGDLLP
jgi:DNA-binding MarR family transcriptional regulator